MHQWNYFNLNQLGSKHSFCASYPVADPGFAPGGAPTPKIAIIFQIFAKNCMKMKEFGPREGGGAPGTPMIP